MTIRNISLSSLAASTLFVAGLCALTTTFSRPASATMTTYTLQDTIFTDGGTGSGYFDFDPTTSTLGAFDIVTTDGTPNDNTGTTFSSPGDTASETGDTDFTFEDSPLTKLFLEFQTPITGNGEYDDVTYSSYEYNQSYLLEPYNVSTRAINCGDVFGTAATPPTTPNNPGPSSTPEPSPALALCLGSGVLFALALLRKKQAPAAN